MVFGIFPVAILGLAFYVFMVALNSPWVWRLQQTGSEQLSSILRYTRVGAVVVGMGFVLYLIYAELIQINAICLWCTSVHVATFLIFALIVFYTSFSTSTSGAHRPGLTSWHGIGRDIIGSHGKLALTFKGSVLSMSKAERQREQTARARIAAQQAAQRKAERRRRMIAIGGDRRCCS